MVRMENGGWEGCLMGAAKDREMPRMSPSSWFARGCSLDE